MRCNRGRNNTTHLFAIILCPHFGHRTRSSAANSTDRSTDLSWITGLPRRGGEEEINLGSTIANRRHEVTDDQQIQVEFTIRMMRNLGGIACLQAMPKNYGTLISGVNSPYPVIAAVLRALVRAT